MLSCLCAPLLWCSSSSWFHLDGKKCISGLQFSCWSSDLLAESYVNQKVRQSHGLISSHTLLFIDLSVRHPISDRYFTLLTTFGIRLWGISDHTRPVREHSPRLNDSPDLRLGMFTPGIVWIFTEQLLCSIHWTDAKWLKWQVTRRGSNLVSQVLGWKEKKSHSNRGFSQAQQR